MILYYIIGIVVLLLCVLCSITIYFCSDRSRKYKGINKKKQKEEVDDEIEDIPEIGFGVVVDGA